jgi:hypothetical protein
MSKYVLRFLSEEPYQYLQASTGMCWSTDGAVAPLVCREYREIEKPKPCPYCGNNSELRDMRGNCVGCGATR